jgi:hypothetical protein
MLFPRCAGDMLAIERGYRRAPNEAGERGTMREMRRICWSAKRSTPRPKPARSMSCGTPDLIVERYREQVVANSSRSADLESQRGRGALKPCGAV